MKRFKLKRKRKLACNNKIRRLRQIKQRKWRISERHHLAFVMWNQNA